MLYLIFALERKTTLVRLNLSDTIILTLNVLYGSIDSEKEKVEPFPRYSWPPRYLRSNEFVQRAGVFFYTLAMAIQ